MNEPRPPGMDCEQARIEIAAGLYEELERDEQAALDAHLAGCGPCRQLSEERRETLALLDGWRMPSLEPPAPGAWGPRPARAPFLKAAAAGLLIAITAFGLCVGVGTTVSSGPDGVVIRFGSAGAVRTLPAVPPAALRGVAGEVVDARLGVLQDDLAGALEQRESLARQRERALVTAFMRLLAEERQILLTELQDLDRRTDGRTRILRDHLMQIATRIPAGASPAERK